MIQIATAISDGLWTRLSATGVATARMPTAIPISTDGDQRATTNASSEASNISGSSWPDRCATTTGTTTATATRGSGTLGAKVHSAKAATGTATKIKSRVH